MHCDNFQYPSWSNYSPIFIVVVVDVVFVVYWNWKHNFYTQKRMFKHQSNSEKLKKHAFEYLKDGIGSLFDPVLKLWGCGQRPYCPPRMEVSYCTFGFGAIIRRDLLTLSFLPDSPRNNLYACVISVLVGKVAHAKRNYLTGLATKKFGGTITHLHTWRQRWLPQQIPPLNFLDLSCVH